LLDEFFTQVFNAGLAYLLQKEPIIPNTKLKILIYLFFLKQNPVNNPLQKEEEEEEAPTQSRPGDNTNLSLQRQRQSHSLSLLFYCNKVLQVFFFLTSKICVMYYLLLGEKAFQQADPQLGLLNLHKVHVNNNALQLTK